MAVKIRPHARERMSERGATEEEVLSTIYQGEKFLAKFNRTGFRRNFLFQNKWKGQYYQTKQLEIYATEENGDLIIVTVVVRYF